MYKHRSPSIAELVANCWDAGAEEVRITIPTEEAYSQEKSEIVIMDSGEGMDADSIQNCYLVVGRNRRQDQGLENLGRKVMGRKGIGKLAGFGLSEHVRVTSWKKNSPAISFAMPLDHLKNTKAGKSTIIRFSWKEVEKGKDWSESGTIIKLSKLRHSTPIDVNSLTETLARRFSRTVRGEMKIIVNGNEINEPQLDTIHSLKMVALKKQL
jgi:HSP90 family molecular chaperone